MIEASLNVALGERAYPIHIGRDLAGAICAEIAQDRAAGRKVALITDAAIARYQDEFLTTAFGECPRLVLPCGEGTKDFRQLQACCEFLATERLDRHSRVFAVGGGVIGDLVGFAAASFQRGIGFYQVPTTLLAMVDSSVGGKTGINLPQGKNLVGAFHQPQAVFADLDCLRTLPPREFAAGMAEVIKHGMLADRALFEDLETEAPLDAGSPLLAEVVYRNCAIKAKVVAADERELDASGGRALLNLGHTFGHAIETVAGYGNYLHGEAVAIGLLLATRFSAERGWVPATLVDRTRVLLERYHLPTRLAEPLPIEALLQACLRDKKARAGSIRLIALQELGQAKVVEHVPLDEMQRLFAG